MEAPPQPPLPATTTTTTTPDSTTPIPTPPPNLRLMCSYGGHIVPRPHDKSLCYVAGETRIISIDRNTSLAALHRRLSKNLLRNQPFSLKYQLPNEDLDSLISISTDEDLENMIEEYDRLSNAAAAGKQKSGRLRIFLFTQSSSSSIEEMLLGGGAVSIKSEDWFFDALNGKSASSDRGFSETSSFSNNLLGLDEDFAGKAAAAKEEKEKEKSVPDSPMVETTSSFGSTSSSPSSLAPVKTHVAENSKVLGLGIEEQFQQQMSIEVLGNGNSQKHEEIGGSVAAGTVVSGMPAVVGGGDYGNRVFSDDERSDHGGYRKVQQVQPQVQAQMHNLPSPDSVSSDGSVTNPLSRQRQAMYQEPIIHFQSGNTRFVANNVDSKNIDQNNTKIQESGYLLPGQYDQNQPQTQTQFHQQPQFMHPNTQYIPAGAVPIQSYYPIYPPQSQPGLDPNYPVYYMSTRQTQAYNQPRNVNSVPSSKPGPQLVQVPLSQHQTQYVGYTQTHHHPSSNSTYAYEFADPTHAQMYYTPLPPQLAAQYQTMTSAAGLADGSTQLTTESVKTLQP